MVLVYSKLCMDHHNFRAFYPPRKTLYLLAVTPLLPNLPALGNTNLPSVYRCASSGLTCVFKGSVKIVCGEARMKAGRPMRKLPCGTGEGDGA